MHLTFRRGIVLAVVLVGGACSGSATSTSTTTEVSAPTTIASTTTAPVVGAEPVVREILSELQDPPGAPGRTLTLARYTIAPGARLPAHIHPGVQMAWIQSGELTYTVISGTATVHRVDRDEPELVEGESVVTLHAGDSVVELGDMVHFGENTSDAPIVILATLLTVAGEDLAVATDANS